MRYDLNYIFKAYTNLVKTCSQSAIAWYQPRCRIYLDEYPNYGKSPLNIAYSSWLMKRFMVKE